MFLQAHRKPDLTSQPSGVSSIQSSSIFLKKRRRAKGPIPFDPVTQEIVDVSGQPLRIPIRGIISHLATFSSIALSSDGILRPNDLKQVMLYQLQEFTMLLDISATARRNSTGVTANAGYRSWWHHYYRLAGFRDASWLNRGARNRLFRILPT
ncbi:hypothetical protein ACSS6W_000238 [Trichoderma asperelloides]